MNTTIVMLALLFIVLLASLIWISNRLSTALQKRIYEELQEINVLLSKMPTENRLKEYMFAQDQRLLSIRENQFSKPDAHGLQQHIQDQANQIIAVIATHDEGKRPSITKELLENTSKVTNQLLERVLWSLRFDEDKYVESTGQNNTSAHSKREKNKGRSNKQMGRDHEGEGDNASMETVLKNCEDDGYAAMLKYMQQSGKSGIEALHALEKANVINNS